MTATARKEMKVSQHEIQFSYGIKNTIKKKKVVDILSNFCLCFRRKADKSSVPYGVAVSSHSL